jgi:pyrimidine 5'-nucleotidase
MCFKVLFIDLDDTLYPSDSGLWDAIKNRIDLYMIERMRLPEEIVPSLRRDLFAKHGTTMRGLQAEYNIDPQDYLDFVHDLPLVEYIRPDPALRQSLEKISQRKVVFTNADTNHATRVIKTLELEGCFDQIIDIRDISPFCKPQAEAFKKAMEIAGVTDPAECIMVDDTLRNLQSAAEAGMYTIQVGAEVQAPGIDAVLTSLVYLPEVLKSEIPIHFQSK